ncbi:MAG TPA: TerD family protein, partial [Candidatus Fimicola cottocaccae]|nr:TerD family protein [Candidatus Fimicola cottocaccae]
MPINLTKGQKVDLTKGNPSLKKLLVGLGWDVNAYDSGASFDLDASAFLVGDNGKVPT